MGMAAECCVGHKWCGRFGGFEETFRKRVVDLPHGKLVRGSWKAVCARKVSEVAAEGLKKERGPSAGKRP